MALPQPDSENESDEAMRISLHEIVNISAKTFTSSGAKLILEALFLIWAVVVNLVYYAQFKGLLISRLGHLVHRWR
jgi:hypothetical protein